MYFSEKITPEMLQRLQAGEDNRPYKTYGSRIVFVRYCEYCRGEYWPKREDQKYCSASCRVRACQKRKRQKSEIAKKSDKPVPQEINQVVNEQARTPTPKIGWQQVGESALGSAAVSGIKYALHDRVLMQKVDHLTRLLENSPLVKTPVSKKPLHYLGLQRVGNELASMFQHPTNGSIFAQNQAGYWFQLVSNNPPQWQPL